MRDEAEKARERYRHGPIGSWVCDGCTHYYIMLAFRPNGLGEIDEDGMFAEHYIEGEPKLEKTFRWRSTGERAIEIVWEGERFEIHYDFRFEPDEYGNRRLTMHEIAPPDKMGKFSFWISPFEVNAVCEHDKA